MLDTHIFHKNKKELVLENLLSGRLNISQQSDTNGKVYFSIRVAFSDSDILTINKNDINELMDELPDIISTAIQARMVRDYFIN